MWFRKNNADTYGRSRYDVTNMQRGGLRMRKKGIGILLIFAIGLSGCKTQPQVTDNATLTDLHTNRWQVSGQKDIT